MYVTIGMHIEESLSTAIKELSEAAVDVSPLRRSILGEITAEADVFSMSSSCGLTTLWHKDDV